MDSFVENSVDQQSAKAFPKDFGELPKEQLVGADFITSTDHSRFPAGGPDNNDDDDEIGKEKMDISQKPASAEFDLLGDSSFNSSVLLNPTKEPTKELDNFDDFFLSSSNAAPAETKTAKVNNLIDILEPGLLPAAAAEMTTTKAQPFEVVEENPDKFNDPSSLSGATKVESDDFVKTKDEIESDYMNPYAEVRPTAPASSKLDEPFEFAEAEPVRAAGAVPTNVEDALFANFTSHISNNKKSQPFTEPMLFEAPEPVKVKQDISPVVPAAVKPTEEAPAAPPQPLKVDPIPQPVASVTNEPPKEKPKPPPAVVAPAKPAPVERPTEQLIEAEQIFRKMGLDAWFKPERLHPRVESLIYWRDVKKSGLVFGSGLTILIAMSLFSLISVFSYVSLLVLFGTVSFRIYKNVLQAVQKTAEGHPFKEYLDIDLTLSQEKVQQLTTVAVAHVNALLTELRRLFLVEDLVDSIKFGVVLYCLTYVGAIFNGMTCVIIAFIALFTLPKVYENNKQSIDAYLDLVRSKILEITEKVKAAVPIGKKSEADKDK